MSDNAPLLAVEDLSIMIGRQAQNLVDGVSFSIMPGETLCIVSESGCGKSVTALALMGLLQTPPVSVTDGRVRFDGRDLLGLSTEAWSALRGDRMAMIFQEPMTALNPAFTIGDQIIESVMRQRTKNAMALANDPNLLIADAPTTALDVTIQAQVINLLEDLKEEFSLILIVITHDLAVVRHMSDRVGVMYLGELVAGGEAEGFFSAPLHPYSRALLAAIPAPDPARRHDGDRPTLTGDIPKPVAPPPGCRFHTRCPFADARCRPDRRDGGEQAGAGTAHRPAGRCRRARSRSVAHLRGAYRLYRALRQARRYRSRSQHRAPARDRLELVG
ncbi:ABC transporter ATP-binding protein [Saliniramus sp.]|uniref:ABC transporter ATP-binding protein n=1 Tax=Saliniramus sp. TaxID=2986772 RepID=UPI0039C9EBF5